MKHEFCQECGQHIGLLKGDKYKQQRTACKLNRHTIVMVDYEPKSPEVKPGEIMKMQDYTPDLNNQFATFTCRIIARGELENYFTKIHYECPICQSSETSQCDEYRRIKTAPNCKSCAVRMIERDELSEVDTIRTLMLQEPLDEAVNMTPVVFEAVTTGKITKKIFIGKDVKTTGIFRSVKKKKENTNRIVFDIKKIKSIEEHEDLLPTDEELEKFKKTTTDQLVDSFAPEVFGLRNEKLALLYSLVSGNKVDDLRGDINVLLVGDPSTAKSRLLKFVLNVTQKSAYALGRSTSAAGLVLGVDKLADGRNIVKAGVVVLCHGGCVCIDEIDKMKAEDRSALHEVMEQQTASLHKIGSNLTLPAETIIIAAANPRSSKYDIKMSIVDNINMPQSLLSRFDLIFLVRDIPEGANDRAIIKHILKVRKGENNCEILTKEELTKYINHARKLKPVFLEESRRIIEDFYIQMRNEEQDSDSLTVDWRGLEGLVRLSTASAKLRFCDKIEKADVEKAIELYKAHLESFGMRTPGEMVQQMLPHDMNKNQYVVHTINAVKDEDGYFYMEDLVGELSKSAKHFKADEEVVRRYLQKMHDTGLLLLGKNNRYKFDPER